VSGRDLAARLYGPGDVRVAPEPVVAPEAGEVTLRVTAVGLCGSDLHWYEDGSIGDAALEQPLIIGHEFSGVIVDGPRAGELVVADPFDACERCEPCRAGRSHLCTESTRFAGFVGTEGALRSTMPWPSHLLHAVPNGIGADEATLLEPLGVALHALDLAEVPAGGRVGVYGCGPIGLLLVQLLRRSGASVVVATDRRTHRVAAACAMGATDGFVVPDRQEPLPDREGPMPDVDALGRHQPVDVAFEVAGDDDALADAIMAVRPGGRVVLVGIPDRDRTTFRAATARRKELTLQLSRRMLPTDLIRAIDLVASGDVDLSGLISQRFPIAETPQAFAVAASRRGLKVVVNPSPTAGTAG
jgi:L-iditol 2-dehydrogenase